MKVLRSAASIQRPIVDSVRGLAMAGLAVLFLSACAGGSPVISVSSPASESAPTEVAPEVTKDAEVQTQASEGAASDIVVYASELPEDALYEFEVWGDPASPEAKMVGTPNNGGDLDAPPENDPHILFPVTVYAGVPYRCWIHMKVGAPKGVSQANKVWVQFTGAVDTAGNAAYAPDSSSFLTVQGPAQAGWIWVPCNLEGAEPAQSQVTFANGGEATVRIQAGMEGVGFDQFVLSPSQFLEERPAQPVVEK
jgi:hypothetical protein